MIMNKSTLHKVLVLLLICFTIKANSQTEHFGICIKDGHKTRGVNMNERFAMNSVMKFPQALYVADYLSRHGITLDSTVIVREADLMTDTWSPMLTIINGKQCFTYAELLAYSLQQSDNNACDLLFKHCGGPAKVSRYMRKLGFLDVHLKKNERRMHRHPSLCNKNWTTPLEIVLLLDWFANHRNDTPTLQYIWHLMANCDTGLKRLPAATPEGGVCIHKTGTGYPSSTGKADMADVGIYLLPDRTIPIAVFILQANDEGRIAEIVRKCLNI